MENDANGDAATATEDTVRTADGRFTFSKIHRYLQDKSYPDGYTKADKTALRKRASFFSFKGSDLYYVGGSSHKENVKQPRLVVEDPAKRKRVIASLHDSNHLGINRTLDMVNAKYYWPGLTKAVKDYVSYSSQ